MTGAPQGYAMTRRDSDAVSRRDSTDDILQRIVSATRLHLPPDAAEIPEATQSHLQKFAAMAYKLGVVAAIAVNSHEESVRTLMREAAPDLRFHVLHVPCWGAFVPALNALLNFAQRFGTKYILYQSLEVLCTPSVLQRLLDHHTADTLVVGPVFDGHSFHAGERPLNGRTAPWNTLALWNVRKLALTGFLQIADGLPDVPPSLNKDQGQAFLQGHNPNPQEPELDSDNLMGSDLWWGNDLMFQRQLSAQKQSNSVPAGVEEVTAIALLQHLHGHDRARAILLQLPPELEQQLSWSASWGKDERRKQWHQYKMASKVSRPAAQLQELFRNRRSSSTGELAQLGQVAGNLAQAAGSRLLRRRSSSCNSELNTQANTPPDTPSPEAAKPEAVNPEVAKEASPEAPAEENANFGVVMHYGESIPPPKQVHGICLAACVLFFANSTHVLATAFRRINASSLNTSAREMTFIALLIGGVYLPMPLSLWLSRTVTARANQIAGLCLFGGFVLVGHLLIVASQVFSNGASMLLAARLVQGLGSGVLFQVRFVLASVSTNDRHMELQSQQFLMSDLGLGLGALLPAATSMLTGSQEQPSGAQDLNSEPVMPSVVLALISLAFLVWVLMAFPKRLPCLPDRVRFPGGSSLEKGLEGMRRGSKAGHQVILEADRSLLIAWVSGTTRVFVQSAILPAIALSMRDAHWTGNFRQTFACAALCLLPMPFEAFVSSMCCTCSFRAHRADTSSKSKMIYGGIGVIALVIAGFTPRDVTGEEGEFITLLARIFELAILMIALGMAAPFNASRFYRYKDAERSIVILEWMKAYIGRLLGPFFAVVVYTLVGYFPLLVVLSLATLLVGVTA